MQEGWIKIYRTITKKGYYKDSNYIHLWIHLLLKVNHEDKEFMFNGKIEKCKRGQLLTGRKKISEETGINESKVERILKFLESEQQIEQQTNNKFRLITVKNYNKFQQVEQQNEQQVNNKRTTSEQQVNTNKNNKNYKNEKKVLDKSNKESFGNKKINEVLKWIKAQIGIEGFADSQKWERIYGMHICNLIDRIGKDEFLHRFKTIVSEDFKRNNCNNIKYLYNQLKGFIEPKKKKNIII